MFEDEIVTQIEGYIGGSLTAMSVDEKNSSISIASLKKGDCIAYDMYNEKLRLTQLVYRRDGGGALNDNYFWSKNGESLFNIGATDLETLLNVFKSALFDHRYSDIIDLNWVVTNQKTATLKNNYVEEEKLKQECD